MKLWGYADKNWGILGLIRLTGDNQCQRRSMRFWVQGET